MKKYRHVCMNCWDKEGKEVVKEFQGRLQEKCDFCKEEMQLQEQLIGEFGKNGPDVSLGWVKV